MNKRVLSTLLILTMAFTYGYWDYGNHFPAQEANARVTPVSNPIRDENTHVKFDNARAYCYHGKVVVLMNYQGHNTHQTGSFIDLDENGKPYPCEVTK